MLGKGLFRFKYSKVGPEYVNIMVYPWPDILHWSPPILSAPSSSKSLCRVTISVRPAYSDQPCLHCSFISPVLLNFLSLLLPYYLLVYYVFCFVYLSQLECSFIREFFLYFVHWHILSAQSSALQIVGTKVDSGSVTFEVYTMWGISLRKKIAKLHLKVNIFCNEKILPRNNWHKNFLKFRKANFYKLTISHTFVMLVSYIMGLHIFYCLFIFYNIFIERIER